MKSDRFDAFARSLPSLPRRAALGGLLGGLLALLAGTGTETAARKKKRRKKKWKKRCKGDRKKCGKRCIPRDACCGGCGEQTCCTGSCADLVTDGANCGFCGNACFRNTCFNGTCACSPAPDEGCPDGCDCIPRLEGGFGCTAFGQPGAACTTDGDCPVGTFCANREGNGNCSLPCLPVS